MERLDCVKVFLLALVMAMPVSAATILHYDFEDGTPETVMNDFPVTQINGTVGTVDLSGNGYDMLAWDDYWGPMFSAEGDTPTGTGLSSVHDGHRDGYCPAAGLVAWSPSTWTIELSFKLNNPNGWRTLIGRDDWTGIQGDIAASMYIQSNGENNAMRITFATVSDERYTLDSSLIPVPGQWYHLAVVADGNRLDMYADQFDGNGFRNIGTLIMDAGVDHSLRPTGTWTFGRGWFNGAFVDHVDGNMDNIRFSDEALTTDQLIPSLLLATKAQAHAPQPPNGAVAVPLDQVLSWTTGVDPEDANVPNPAITGHNLWLSIPYSPTNPPINGPNWQDPGVQIIPLLADVNPADGNVDATASYSPPGLQRDALYFWIVDESLGAAHPRDWDNIIAGIVWSFGTVTSGPAVEAGSNFVTWLEEGASTVDLNGTVTDATGDVTTIAWTVLASPDEAVVDIADTSVAATSVTVNKMGRYELELYAKDAAQNEGSDTMEINVYGDSCEAAKNHPDGYVAPEYDFNDDCKVNFADLALFAAAWLEDASLTGPTPY